MFQYISKDFSYLSFFFFLITLLVTRTSREIQVTVAVTKDNKIATENFVQ